MRFIEPMYAAAVQSLPETKDRLYEIKLDGYRCLAGRDEKVTLWSRRGNIFTCRFPNIAGDLRSIPSGTLLDGEIVAIDETGRPSFNLIQNAGSEARCIRYYVFDVLFLNGKSLMTEPLAVRREILAENIIATTGDSVVLSETFEADPAHLIQAAAALGVEGIVAKRIGSLYESGKKTGSWVKYKIHQSQEFVVGGYVPGSPFDSLIVGCYDGGKLNYVAKVRNGFVPRSRLEVFERIKRLNTEVCPFTNLPEKKRTQWALTKEEMKNCIWLKPISVAQIAFTEWTPDGHLREARFIALRDDKNPLEVVREAPLYLR
jgi:bifunctional non-homologous end joining protein LigD